jgi:hypothetical protein
MIATTRPGTCGAYKGAFYNDGHVKCHDNPGESYEVAGRLKRQSLN